MTMKEVRFLNEGENLERMVNCGSKLTRCFFFFFLGGGAIRGGAGEKMQTRIHLDRYLSNIIVIYFSI